MDESSIASGCPNVDLSYLTLVSGSMLTIFATLAGSTHTPSLNTIWPRSVPNGTTKMYLFKFKYI